MAALERENRELRETVQSQEEELETLRRQAGELGERGKRTDGGDVVDGLQGQPEDWPPPRRGHGLPDDGMVKLDDQPDEAHAFGPAAPLASEWRQVRSAGW